MRSWIRLLGGPDTFLAMAVALVGLAGLGDYATGNDLAFTLFYLGPVALAAWCSGALRVSSSPR